MCSELYMHHGLHQTLNSNPSQNQEFFCPCFEDEGAEWQRPASDALSVRRIHSLPPGGLVPSLSQLLQPQKLLPDCVNTTKFVPIGPITPSSPSAAVAIPLTPSERLWGSLTCLCYLLARSVLPAWRCRKLWVLGEY